MVPEPSRGPGRKRRLRRYLATTMRWAIPAVVLVAAISLTVGTGVAPVDDAVDDAYSGLSDVIESVTGSSSPQAGNGTGAVNATTERARLELAVHERANEARTSRGLDPLAFDTDLREITRYHSEDMAERDYFSHTSPDGATLEDRYERFGYVCRVPSGLLTYKGGGENLFMTSSSQGLTDEELADRVVTGWLNSPGHRRNLLDPDWRRQGIGVATASDGAVYVTQNFC